MCNYLQEIHQNGGFTKVWVAQKSVLFPALLIATLLFTRQVRLCDSSPLLITRVIQSLGAVNVIYNGKQLLLCSLCISL